jgi:hypothetical protein
MIDASQLQVAAARRATHPQSRASGRSRDCQLTPRDPSATIPRGGRGCNGLEQGPAKRAAGAGRMR